MDKHEQGLPLESIKLKMITVQQISSLGRISLKSARRYFTRSV